MSTRREKIINVAIEILKNRPNGIGFAELRREIKKQLPEIEENTIRGTIWDLHTKIREVEKPERGLFILKEFLANREKSIEVDATKSVTEKETGKRITEYDFYDSFANYLVQELEECSRAVRLAGNAFGGMWGTPDVLGVYKFPETAPVKPPIEIVSAEIKIETDANKLLPAFGQACSYKLFSHKVYLVIPKDTDRDICGRIESLCLRFGIGLILFDKNNPDNPDYEIIARAVKSEPDYYYLNLYLGRLSQETKELLFG
ncbi:MAG: hypothetical protein ABIK10_04805 [candidate division WOR-3 bacterium]